MNFHLLSLLTIISVVVGWNCVSAQADLDFVLRQKMEQLVGKDKQVLEELIKQFSEVHPNEAANLPLHSYDHQADADKVQLLQKLDDILQSKQSTEWVFKVREFVRTTNVDAIGKVLFNDFNEVLETTVDGIESLVKESGKMIDAKWIFALKAYLSS